MFLNFSTMSYNNSIKNHNMHHEFIRTTEGLISVFCTALFIRMGITFKDINLVASLVSYLLGSAASVFAIIYYAKRWNVNNPTPKRQRKKVS